MHVFNANNIMYHLLIVGCQGTLECYYFAVTLLPVTLVQVTKGTCSLDLNNFEWSY